MANNEFPAPVLGNSDHDVAGVELLKLNDAAKVCSMSPRTFWGKSEAGLAPPKLKIGEGRGGCARWSRRALEQWVSAGCPRVAPPKAADTVSEVEEVTAAGKGAGHGNM